MYIIVDKFKQTR